MKGFHDINPRMGLAYDVFGNGKTSFKTSFSKYLQPANNESVFITGNNAVTFAQTTDRSWFDADGDYVADCNLNNSAANGECGPWANGNFGKASSGTVVNPEVLEGWGSRPYDWQFAVSLQQEVLPRVSANIGYNRRMWGNFYYTDNRAVGPGDFDRATITAPPHPDLPDGGGYPVSFHVVKEAKFGAVDNYFTFAKDYGDVTYYWHGFDYDVNARMANGLVIQGGGSTGRGIRDTCEVEAALPEATYGAGFGAAQRQIDACAVNESWQTNLRGLVSYVLPKVDVQLSAIWRSVANTVPQTDQNAVATNGLSLNANYDVTSAQVLASIGRPLPGGAATQSVNLVKPGEVFGPRITHDRSARHQDPAVRQLQDERRPGPLQPVQRQHRHRVQPGVRAGRGHLAAADGGDEPALPPLQCDGGLVRAGSGLTGYGLQALRCGTEAGLGNQARLFFIRRPVAWSPEPGA